MIRLPTVTEVLWLHEQVIQTSGGAAGLRDQAALESAVAQPRMTFGGADLYPSVIEKAAAVAFSLVNNHPFVDGNKRIAHATMELTLVLNGRAIEANVAEQERLFLGLASGMVSREELVSWLEANTVPAPA